MTTAIHLVAEGVDAERARGGLVLADRLPVEADAALEQDMAEHEGRDGERQHHVVEHGRVAAQVPKVVAGVVGDRQEEAARAADPPEMVEADARELGEGDGEDGEIDAGDAEAEGEEADDGAADDGDRDRGRKSEPRPDAEMHVERRGGIGAEPDIDGVAERELAGEAHHHVPRLPGIGEIQDGDEDGEQIVVGEPRRREQRRRAAPAAARGCGAEPPRAASRIMSAASPECPAAGTAAPARAGRRRTCSSPTA